MDRVSCAQNGKDATNICIPQYREAFFRLMSSGGTLFFAGCRWTDAEVKQLAAALQCAHAAGATSQADVLDLGGNQLTQGGGTLKWSDVIGACKANRLAPLTPPAFEKLMTEGMANGKIKFTVRRPPSNRQPVS